jgi:tetratricopeptide (TPR) repeat protein
MKISENKLADPIFEKSMVKVLVKDDLRAKYAKELEEQHSMVRTEPTDSILEEPAISRLSTSTIIRLNRFAKIAAMLIVVSGSFLLVTKLQSNGPQQMAMSMAKETMILGNQDIMRKDGKLSLKMRLEANTAFINQKYDEAIQHYVKLEATGDVKDIDYFYLGVSYLKLDKNHTVEALKAFDQLKKDSRIARESKWFKALALTMNGNYPNAKLLLQEIIAANDYKSSEAKTLLSKF